ncbi:probable polygalacturonase At1g80170 [Pyrus communis]|uniref:probable polygalacturonase At1g80170 n=1 Tax=Pyrus communis TaxID=23211 RepID=UPI0035C1ABF1
MSVRYLRFRQKTKHCGTVLEKQDIVVANLSKLEAKMASLKSQILKGRKMQRLSGVIVAPNTAGGWKGADLLAFRGVNGLTLNGSGLIDGRGKSWWDVSCRHHPELKGCIGRAPTALMFQGCKEVQMDRINVVNTPQTHILVWGSEGAYFSFIKTDSPGTSPNTDGIHIQDSQHVEIHGAELKSGRLFISRIFEYFGTHWELREQRNETRVENIAVHRARFYGTQNGARIKTWETGKGLVHGVSFVNLTFKEVGNPITIDQHYFCHKREGCHELSTAVQISDVSYSGAIGTSISEVAINLNCSTPVPCTGITLENCQLASADPDMKITSSCHSVHGVIKGIVEPPVSCL